MKAPRYCVIIPDGMADDPLEELGNRTPLEAADTPAMDSMAAEGRIGLVHTIPSGFPPGSDVGHLSLLGYDPDRYYTGRAPLEAASMGLKIAQDEIVFRCNLVTVANNVMEDFSAGHIQTPESTVIIAKLNAEMGGEDIRFHPGISYRHLLVYSGKKDLTAACTPPHDIQGQPVKNHLPKGKGARFLADLMDRSRDIISEMTINKVRIDLQENPATQIWLWGQGKPMGMPSFEEKFGVSGSMIAAVDLVRGIGASIGLERINVPGATGYVDTDFAAKGRFGIKALKKDPFVVIHIEAPDEASHAGNAKEKIHAIEQIDQHIIGPVLVHLRNLDEPYRIMVLPDHTTSTLTRTHSNKPVPVVMCGQGIKGVVQGDFTEKRAYTSDLILEKGYEIMEYFMGKQGKWH